MKHYFIRTKRTKSKIYMFDKIQLYIYWNKKKQINQLKNRINYINTTSKHNKTKKLKSEQSNLILSI